MNGTEITGTNVYQSLTHKFANAYVMPQGLVGAFKRNKINARIYRESLEQLLTRLNDGQPLIVLIGDGANWQHYVTVVGYSKNKIYLYDSLRGTSNVKGYNRVMMKTYFSSLWTNKIPHFETIYYVLG